MPNFVTTFRSKMSADVFRNDADFVTLQSNPLNQTRVKVQVVLKLSEPCPKMNFKVKILTIIIQWTPINVIAINLINAN
jgi:hypothetical protein